MTSKYHTVQFILNVATSYHGNWQDFMHRIDKMYEGYVPQNLLDGLKRIKQDDHMLCALCDEHERKNKYHDDRVLRERETHAEKERRWQERRNAGNSLAWTRYRESCNQAQKYRTETELERVALEQYIKEMKPKWDQQMKEYQLQREKQLKDIMLHD